MIWFGGSLKARLIVAGIIIFIAGISLTVSSLSDIIKLNGNVPDFNSESIADIKKGDFVCGYIANIFDNYANKTTTENGSSRVSREYFIMPLINDKDYDKELYITVSASKREDINLLNAIMDDTYDFLDGKEDVEWHEMAFVGRAVELDPKLNQYLVEWFEENEFFDDDAQNHIIPYELVYFDTSNMYTNLAIGLVLTAICIVVALVIYFRLRPKKTADNSAYTAPADTGNAFSEAAGSENTFSGAAASGNVSSETTASGNAFSEAPAAGVRSVPQIPQPAVDPDDFFAKPPKPAKAEESPKPPEPPKPEPVSKPAPVDHSAGIDTASLDVEKALHEQEKAVAANYRPVDNNQGIETHNLDTDKALHEQERAAAANYKPIDHNQGIETHELDTDKALYEQERAAAANQKQVEHGQGIDTESLDVDKALYEQERAVSANAKILEDNGGIDTSELNTDSLDYFDHSASGTEEDDIFDFSNDYDYGEIDPDNIEIT